MQKIHNFSLFKNHNKFLDYKLILFMCLNVLIFILNTLMSDISTHYGGSILAMIGKDHIALVNDKRLGTGPITVNTSFSKIYQLNSKLLFGFTGLYSDSQILFKKIRKNYNLFVLEHNREMEPKELSNMISYILYTKRLQPYYVTCIVCGISSDNTPFISGMDCIGAKDDSNEFVTAGTASKNLFGLCEALFEPGMDEDTLFVTAVQAFLNSVDRDALSGWGCECFIVGKNELKKKEIKGRCD